MNLPRFLDGQQCICAGKQGGHRLIDIAKRFALKRTGSVPTTLGKLKEMLRVDQKLKDKVDSAI